jgi:hypothetical protein
MLLISIFVFGFLQLKRQNKITRKGLFFLSIPVTLLALLAVPFDSTDVSVYINQGWLQVHYGLNPFTVAVAQIEHWNSDPFFKEHWINSPCQYGPIFALLCKIVVALCSSSYLLCVFAIKALAAACHLGITAMLLWIFNTDETEKDSTVSAYLYAFNPFVLLQCVSNAHNDIFVAFFSCTAIALAFRKKFLYASIAFATGVLVKYVPLIAAPFFCFFLWLRASRSAFILAMSAAIAYILCISSVYFYGMDSEHFHALLEAYTSSDLSSLISLVAGLQLGNLRQICVVGAAVVIVTYFVLRFKNCYLKSEHESKLELYLAHDMAVSQALLLCLLSSKFQFWYIVSFLPLTLIQPWKQESVMRNFAICSSQTLLFGFLWFGFPGGIYTTVLLFLAFIAALVAKQMTNCDDT